MVITNLVLSFDQKYMYMWPIQLILYVLFDAYKKEGGNFNQKF